MAPGVSPSAMQQANPMWALARQRLPVHPLVSPAMTCRDVNFGAAVHPQAEQCNGRLLVSPAATYRDVNFGAAVYPHVEDESNVLPVAVVSRGRPCSATVPPGVARIASRPESAAMELVPRSSPRFYPRELAVRKTGEQHMAAHQQTRAPGQGIAELLTTSKYASVAAAAAAAAADAAVQPDQPATIDNAVQAVQQTPHRSQPPPTVELFQPQTQNAPVDLTEPPVTTQEVDSPAQLVTPKAESAGQRQVPAQLVTPKAENAGQLQVEPSMDTPPPIAPPQGFEQDVPDIQVGDLVLLGSQVVTEFRHKHAVVTEVHEAHCTVAVLDESHRFGVGECWPDFSDVRVLSTAWRLGSEVVIDGLQGGKTRAFNGKTGVIIEHPKQGHPCFVHKPSGVGTDDRAHLTLCISLPPAESGGKEKKTLLEPRFLHSVAAYFDTARCNLEGIVRQVSGDHRGSFSSGCEDVV